MLARQFLCDRRDNLIGRGLTLMGVKISRGPYRLDYIKMSFLGAKSTFFAEKSAFFGQKTAVYRPKTAVFRPKTIFLPKNFFTHPQDSTPCQLRLCQQSIQQLHPSTVLYSPGINVHLSWAVHLHSHSVFSQHSTESVLCPQIENTKPLTFY